MSYARFSAESDVYCYEDVSGGYRLHVATRRQPWFAEMPRMPHLFAPGGAKVFSMRRRFSWAFYRARVNLIRLVWRFVEMPKIGLSEDGRSITTDDAESLMAELVSLRCRGYRVPQYTLDRLASVAAEEKADWLHASIC